MKPFEDKFVKINDITICYSTVGEGFPVFMIHGYGAKKSAWIAQVPELSEHFKLIFYDLRGTGKSDRPNYKYSMEMLVNDLKNLMKSFSISKAHLIGRSLGGMIVQNFALFYPEMLEKMVIITSNYGKNSSDWVDITINNRIKQKREFKGDFRQLFLNTAKVLFYQKFRRKMENNPSFRFFDVWSTNDLIEDNSKDPMRERDIINLGESMRTHYTYNDLKKIKAQTLLIGASHDRLTPLSVMQEMNELIPNSDLKVIEKAGHYCTLSRAQEINEFIMNFLKA